MTDETASAPKTRNVTPATKRIRALAKIERLKARVADEEAKNAAAIQKQKDKYGEKMEKLAGELIDARADYKNIVGEDCPL